jgi:hypothetical protein
VSCTGVRIYQSALLLLEAGGGFYFPPKANKVISFPSFEFFFLALFYILFMYFPELSLDL